jgi:hypothetical protein
MLSIKHQTLARINGLTGFREGIFLNFRDGTYHLTYSIDDTGSPNYRVGYATSTSVDGPWTYRGVILEKDTSQGILGTGHSSIIQVPGTDDWYIAYHRFGLPGGDGTHRETTIDRLTFNSDGTMAKVIPTLESIDPLTFEGTKPVATVSDSGLDGWYGPDAALTLTGDATTAALEYRIGDGAWTAYTTPVELPGGAYDVAYRAQGTNLQWSETWTLAVKVGPASTVSAQLKDSTPKVGKKTKLAVTVSTRPATEPATGQVQVRIDGELVQTLTLVRGQADTKLVFATAGEHEVVVRYAGTSTGGPAEAVLTVSAHR